MKIPDIFDQLPTDDLVRRVFGEPFHSADGATDYGRPDPWWRSLWRRRDGYAARGVRHPRRTGEHVAGNGGLVVQRQMTGEPRVDATDVEFDVQTS
jgi:hypothetical protein